jgi:hypothetical protein
LEAVEGQPPAQRGKGRSDIWRQLLQAIEAKVARRGGQEPRDLAIKRSEAAKGEASVMPSKASRTIDIERRDAVEEEPVPV